MKLPCVADDCGPSAGSLRFRRWLLGLLIVTSLAALAGALLLEHRFGVVGCILCTYQRVPYAVAAALAAAALGLQRRGSWHRIALGLCGISFLAGSGLALYHVGVQQSWWADFGVCTRSEMPTLDAGNLRAEVLAEAGRPPCDEVDWQLFGISLAGFNALMSSGLALLCAIGFFATGKRGPASARNDDTQL